MGDVGIGINRVLSDSDGDLVGVTSNKLDVNASATDLDIRDLTQAQDNLLIYGYDYSSANQKLKVDSSGLVYVKSIADAVAVTGTFWQSTQPVSGTLTVNTISGFATSSNQLAAGHAIDCNDSDVTVTSTVQPAGSGTFTSYAAFDAPTSVGELADSGGIGNQTDCKEIILQAGTGNSEFIMVGSSGTAATGTLKGVKLSAGDTFILPIANTELVFIDASTTSQSLLVSIVK